MHAGSPLLFAILFSLDALVAGVACGLRRLAFPTVAGLLLGLISALVLLAGGLAGTGLALVLPPALGRWLGGAALAGLGIWMVRSARHGESARRATWADRDRSGDLSPGELVWLGAGLGADGFTGAAALALSGARAGTLATLGLLLGLTTALCFHAGYRLARHTLPDTGERAARSAAGWLLLALAVVRVAR